jgi:hypothetical protein
VHAQAEELTAAAEERRNVDARSGYLERVVLKTNGCITFLDVDDVDWIEAAGLSSCRPQEPPVPLQRHPAAATP